MRTVIALLLLIASAGALAQADYAREKRWAEEITPAILVGDAIMLTLPSGRSFLALHTLNAKARAGIIVVHGLGVHPDWELINVLRSELAERGYATLSVQMPVLSADARGDRYPPLFPEAADRLAVAVNYLRDRGHGRVAIVSHSLGARMTNVFLNRPDAPAIDAWVAIGISGEYTKPSTFRVPVLDLMGENDLPAVLEHASARADAISRIRGSGQVSIASAGHFFRGREKPLVDHVRLFLDRVLR